MLSQPWLTVFPGAAIMLTETTANLFGDALKRELVLVAWDYQMRRSCG
jgi:ABC-type dipeptide/oligopeptide/nickel transport system permease subunit